ncbi:non-ribosomal peptide synthetase, partial [Methylobacterium crusticola]
SFFEAGGDSITALLLVARLRDAGLAVSPREVFEHQTVAALARAARPSGTAVPAVPAGPAPLTPVQHWFLDQAMPRPGHWNQSVRLDLAAPVDPGRLDRALGRLVRHHEALRLRVSTEGARRQEPVPAAALPPLLVTAGPAAAEAAFAAAERGLDPASGRVLAAVLVTGDPGRLLLTAHHLAVDAVSWRILLEDLAALLADEAAALPAATPFRAFARALAARAVDPALREEAAFWIESAGGPIPALPYDDAAAGRRRGDAGRAILRLSAEATAALGRAAASGRMGLDAVLLAGLVRAVGGWSGAQEVPVTLERHGRDDGLGLDLHRAVGWFTATLPVRLPVADDPVAQGRAVKRALAALPGRGLGYGLLRHLARHPGVAALPEPAIAFNHLGRIDARPGAGPFTLAPDGMSLSADADAPLGADLIVDSAVEDGALVLRLTYAGRRFRPATIADLTGRLADALGAAAAAADAPGLAAPVPGDFPLAGLTQAALDRLSLPWERVEDLYPLTPAQAGILFHALAAPGAGLYVNQLRADLAGLDPARFAAAWRAALARHPALRTAFAWGEPLERPLQAVHAGAALPVRLLEGREHDPAACDALAAEERERGFDLGEPPLMRLALLRQRDGHHLIWTCHHLLLDGWSSARLLAEILRTYAGETVEAPARRFREHVAGLAARDGAADAEFWRRETAPLDGPTLAAGAFAGEPGARGHAVAETPLGAARVARLTQAARRERVTLGTLVQAAWALTLGQLTGRATTAFGITVSGRPAEDAGLHAVLGPFINTVPRVVTAPAGVVAGDWLRALQARGAAMAEHAGAPLAAIQAWAGRPGSALFDTLLVVENYPLDAVLHARGAGGLSVGPVRTHEVTDLPLTLSLMLEGTPRLAWSSARAAFRPEEVASLRDRFLHVLDALAAGTAAPLEALELAPPADVAAARARAAARQDAAARPVVARILGHAARRPDAVALSDRGRSLAYRDLDRLSARVARHLAARGVRPGDRVGLCAGRSAELVVALLGILRSGAAYLPLDPTYPAERLAHMLADSGAALVLAGPEGRAPLAGCAALVLPLAEALGPGPDAPGPDAALPAAGPDLPAAGPDLPAAGPDLPAYVIYTSGSTGAPKGAVIDHRALARLLTATEPDFRFGPDDVWTLFHAYGFDFSVWEMFGALCHGGRLVVVPQETARDPDAFLDLLVRERVTVLNQTPSAFRPLAEAVLARAAAPDLALRTVIFGGEALDLDALRPWLARFGDARPRLVNMYGITETTVHVTLRPVAAPDLEAAARSPIGEAIPDLVLHLVDDALDPVPDGVPGEIVVGGPGLAQGYLNRPGLTAARFVPDPFGPPGARLYRSGDLALRRPDGSLDYLGRRDGQVKLRGYRIETGEVAAALRAEPGVRDAAITLREAPDGPQLVAYAVGADLDADGLRAALARRLPDHMVPARIVPLPRLPLTPNGKLDLRALPAPSGEAPAGEAPAGATEAALAAIWRDLLGLPGDPVRDADFFALGGHSLTATQVAVRVRRALGVEVPIRTLFEARTLRALAREVDARAAAAPAGDAALSAIDAILVELEG